MIKPSKATSQNDEMAQIRYLKRDNRKPNKYILSMKDNRITSYKTVEKQSHDRSHFQTDCTSESTKSNQGCQIHNYIFIFQTMAQQETSKRKQ